MKNSVVNLSSITLSKLLYLEFGQINQSSPSINLTSTGTTNIFTVPSNVTGFDVFLFKIRMYGANTTGSLIISIGTNNPTYDNMVPITTLTGFNTIGDLWIIPVSGKTVRAVASDNITINVSTSVTGPGALANVYMYGEIIQ